MYMPLLQKYIYTINDIYALPDGSRAELVDGQIYNMAPPNTRHQDISMTLSTIINHHISSSKGNCKVYAAPFAVFLNDNDTNYFEPDISVICDKDKLDDAGCHGAPDFIVEIVSPSSRRMDYSIKQYKYCDAGVKEYWIVDPFKETITVYNYQLDDAPIIYRFTDTIKVHVFDDLYIDFDKLSKSLAP